MSDGRWFRDGWRQRALSQGQPVEAAISYPDYLYYRDHNRVFSGLASHFNSGARLVDRDRAALLNPHVVSANYFAVLGVTPSVGRFFRADEDAVPGRDPAVVQ